MRVRIVVRPSFFLYLVIVFAAASWESGVALLTALTVHEAAHILVARIFREPVERIEIAPFGGVMTYQAGRSPSKGVKGVAVAASGPLGNYLLALLLCLYLPKLHNDLAEKLLVANLTMMLVNLLPALPLDGGAVLFSIGYYLFDVSRLISVLCASGIVMGIGLCLIGLWGWIHLGVLNLSVLIVGCYIALWALRSKDQMMTENLYAVMQERMEQRKGVLPVQIYRVSRDEQLLALLRALSRTQAAVFVVEDYNGLHPLTEKEVCTAMLNMPYATIADILQNQIS